MLARNRVLAAALAAAAAGTVGGRVAAAQSREEVVRHYAPTIYQETDATRPRHDFITSYDYDCDWNGDNNREGIDAGHLPALVYYAVYETDTHWFVHYLPYHPTDDKPLSGHEHDTESILLVIRRTETPFGVLEAMETRFHINWYQYVRTGAGVGDAGDNVDGPIHFDTDGVRPAVYQQAVGHGICGGFAPPCITGDWCELAVVCSHNEAPHFNRRGVRYRYGGTSAEPRAPGASDMLDAAYDLVPIDATLWARRGEIGRGRVYASAIDYHGSRCGTDAGLVCPTGFGGNFEGDEGSPPGAMWAQEGGSPSLPTGEVFFDPAYAMSRRLAFPAPFALTYGLNPYAGVGTLAPMRAGTVCGGPVPDDAGSEDAAVDASGDDAAGADDVAGADDSGSAGGADASDARGSGDAGAGDARGDGGAGGRSGGCGCRAAGGEQAEGAGALAAAIALAGVAARRRRRRERGAAE